MLKMLTFWGKWLLWIVLAAGAIVGVTYEDQQARVKYQRDCYEYIRQITALSGHKPAGDDNCKDPKDYMPWWDILVAWPEGITGWAIILTLGAISWQAFEARKATDVAKDAVNAAYGSVTFAQAQWKLTIEKERARLEIQVTPVEVIGDDMGPFGWDLKANVRVRNIGSSRAYIIRSAGSLAIKDTEAPLPEIDGLDALSLPEGFIDPNTPPIESSKWFFPQGAEIREVADDLLESKRSLHLYGYIVYETLGFQRQTDFAFKWRVLGNLSARAIFGLPNTEPETDSRRISGGYWQPDPEPNDHPVESNPEA